jgi:RimJ/RimL family protein N-acetyltransferase
VKLGLAPREHFSWIAERAQVIPGSEFRGFEAVNDSGRIVGMLGFDGWTKTAVNVHIAVEHPAALRHLVRNGFELAFVRLGLAIMLCQVLGNNERSLRLVRHLGFREICRVRDGWSMGVDMVLFEMRREECRFLPRQTRRRAA